MSIILIGGTGTGKSTVGKIICMNTGYKVCEIGHTVKMMFYYEVLRDNSGKYNNCVDIKNFTNNYFFSSKKETLVKKRLQYVSEKVNNYGSDYFLKRLLEREKSNKIIIIGVRNKKEIDIIKEKIPNSFFVFLKCNEIKLTKRFIDREITRMNKNNAVDIFEKRRLIENNWGIEEAMYNCNLIINTDNSKPSDISRKIITEYLEFLGNRRKGIIKNDKRIIY